MAYSSLSSHRSDAIGRSFQHRVGLFRRHGERRVPCGADAWCGVSFVGVGPVGCGGVVGGGPVWCGAVFSGPVRGRSGLGLGRCGGRRALFGGAEGQQDCGTRGPQDECRERGEEVGALEIAEVGDGADGGAGGSSADTVRAPLGIRSVPMVAPLVELPTVSSSRVARGIPREPT